MSRIKLETITPVHIGSGNFLQYGTDFLSFRFNEHDYLGVIDDRKILNLIGKENIDKWVQSIERNENTDSIVKRYAPNAKIKDYSRRCIYNFSRVNPNDTLKECLHNGFGLPYIPGSSIKGSIRTALLSTLANTISDKEKKIISGKDKYGNNKISASKIEKELFGKDPYSDIFRFLQVGDAYFEKETEISTRVININIRSKQSFWDTSKPQLIEAIGADSFSTIEMKINNIAYSQAKNIMPQMPNEMQSLTNLFQTINLHTKKLIEEDIRFWNGYINEKNIDSYIEKMQEILNYLDNNDCKIGKSCILRIGHAAGWRFITGAWSEELANFEKDIIPAARPNNYKYSEYAFPKTRRVDEDCDLLGFIKLSTIKN